VKFIPAYKTPDIKVIFWFMLPRLKVILEATSLLGAAVVQGGWDSKHEFGSGNGHWVIE
jgi:hypothetical protein